MSQESSTHHFINLFSAQIVASFSQIFSTILLLKWIGVSLFAQYTVATAAIAIINSVSSLGWENYFPIFLKEKNICLESYLHTASTIQAYQLLIAISALSVIGYIGGNFVDLNYAIIVLVIVGKSLINSKQNYVKILLSNSSLGKPERNAKFISSIIQLVLILVFSQINARLYMLFIALLIPILIEYRFLILSAKNILNKGPIDLTFRLYSISLFRDFSDALCYFRSKFLIVFPFWINNVVNSFTLSVDIVFCRYLGLPDKAIASYGFAKSAFSVIRLLPFTAYRTALARYDSKKLSIQDYLNRFKRKIYKMSSVLIVSCFSTALFLQNLIPVTGIVPGVETTAISLFMILIIALVGQTFLSIALLRLNLIGEHIIFNFAIPIRSVFLLVLLISLGNAFGVQGVALSVSLSVCLVGIALLLYSENLNLANSSSPPTDK